MRKPIDASDAIRAINPNSNVTTTFHGDGRITYDWNDTPQISQADIDAKIVELEAEWDALAWKRSREAEYPAIADQLDEIYHNGIDSWKALIKVTKDKYPKG